MILSAYAENIRVISLQKFSTLDPAPTYRAKILDPCILQDGTILGQNTVISGKVIRVQNAKRGKRDGYFDIEIDKINDYGVIRKIKSGALTARIVGYSRFDPQEAAFTAARTAATFVFKGVVQGYYFTQGFMSSKGTDRVKSGLINAYKHSIISYLEPGEELTVQEGDLLILKLKSAK